MLQGWPFSMYSTAGVGKFITHQRTVRNQWDGADLASGVYYYRLVSPCMAQAAWGCIDTSLTVTSRGARSLSRKPSQELGL